MLPKGTLSMSAQDSKMVTDWCTQRGTNEYTLVETLFLKRSFKRDADTPTIFDRTFKFD
jgi:hypothetical protein